MDFRHCTYTQKQYLSLWPWHSAASRENREGTSTEDPHKSDKRLSAYFNKMSCNGYPWHLTLLEVTPALFHAFTCIAIQWHVTCKLLWTVYLMSFANLNISQFWTAFGSRGIGSKSRRNFAWNYLMISYIWMKLTNTIF